ncbi:protein DGCR6 isoform X2 [Vulpes vulpes]|uniref:Protein DGCR6 isoform X2 n=1 Tax=Vulpes vulpes TaxID=9627 RepID=A0A3Q7QZD3_VULVU|nr:protein DGCR6L isoform X1 [Vulpes vulpes]XP_041584750.1 protein DGCR6L isoform X1 [Vulpes lagopus]
MERYPGSLDEAVDGARQQERHYQLLSALQSLVKELPSSFQQRLSYTTLSDLALALLDGTVFEIVQGLLEIQHLTEKSLYNQRLRLQNEHRVLRQALRQKHQEAQQACRPHNLPVLQAAQQRELEAVEHRIREEQRAMDQKIVLELDRKVADQQSTLEKAGVAGFYVTTNPQQPFCIPGADTADEPVGTHQEAATEGLPGGQDSPVISWGLCQLPAARHT